MVYTPEDTDEARRFSQALCQLQQQKWSDVLRSFQNSPILVHHQGDSTPIRHGVHIAGHSRKDSTASVRRYGTQTSEAYLHRMYLVTGNEHTDFVKAHRVLPPCGPGMCSRSLSSSHPFGSSTYFPKCLCI